MTRSLALSSQSLPVALSTRLRSYATVVAASLVVSLLLIATPVSAGSIVGQAVQLSPSGQTELSAVWSDSIVRALAAPVTVVLDNSQVVQIASNSSAHFGAGPSGAVRITVASGSLSYAAEPRSAEPTTLKKGESVAFDEDGNEDDDVDFLAGVVAVLSEDADSGAQEIKVDATESINPRWPVMLQAAQSVDCAVLDVDEVVDDETVQLKSITGKSFGQGTYVIQGERVQEAMDEAEDEGEDGEATCTISTEARNATPGGSSAGSGSSAGGGKAGRRAVWIGLGAAAAAVTGYEVLDDDDGDREPTTVAEPDLLPPN